MVASVSWDEERDSVSDDRRHAAGRVPGRGRSSRGGRTGGSRHAAAAEERRGAHSDGPPPTALDASGVTFRTKSGKTVTLDPVAFLERFVEHVLPVRFVKIRHYGLLAPSNVATQLPLACAALEQPVVTERAPDGATDDWRARLLALTAIDVAVCTACGASAVVREPLPAARAPPEAA